MTTPQQYRTLFDAGKRVRAGTVTGLVFRILRGLDDLDFVTTTCDLDENARKKGLCVPNRKSVLFVDAQAGADMIGAGGTYGLLKAVGYDEADIAKHAREGLKFKLLVCADDGSSLAVLGTWDNILTMAGKVYPRIVPILTMHASGLKSISYAEIQKMGNGTPFTQVKNDHPDYMSADRLASMGLGASLRDARRFFYDSLALRSLYRGDGFTYNDAGVRGVEEYIAPTCELSKFGNYELIDLPTLKMPTATVGRASNSNELPVPAFFNGANASSWSYGPNTRKLFEAATPFRDKHKIQPASTDAIKRALLVIDVQKDFCFPEGALYVGGQSGNGAIDDNRRLAEFSYRCLNRITSWTATMDTHTPYQIFSPSFWQERNGNAVTMQDAIPNTQITVDDILSGKYAPSPLAACALNVDYSWLVKQVTHYCKELAKAGKYTLFLWNEHCLLGSEGHALTGIMQEVRMFHSFVRGAQNTPEIKGGNPLTENYSVLSPEVLTRHDGKPLAQKNTAFIQTLLKNDYVIIAGQAASHCVASSIDDLLSEILAKDASLAAKVYVMEDCMSPVVIRGVCDFTPQATAALKRFADHGMHVVKSTDPMESWTGMRV